MTTVSQLIEMLKKYPEGMSITNEQNESFIHIVNIKDRLIISTNPPIGYCARSGEYVYPSKIGGYTAFSPEFDEDLYSFEWEPLKTN